MKRTAIGLAVAAGVAAVLGWLLSLFAADAVIQAARERGARQRAAALAAVVERAGPAGNRVRAAVAAFQAQDPAVARVRVVLLDGRLLQASTSPQDGGERAAPRALAMDEKPLFDLAQALRAAVATNREEGAARKDEIATVGLASGGLSLAAPLQRGADVVGMVQLELAPPERVGAPSVLTAIAAWLVPLLLFAVVAIPLRGRPALLVGAAAVLLLAAVVAQTQWAGAWLTRTAAQAGTAGAQGLRDLGERASRSLEALPAPEPEPGEAAAPPEEGIALPEQSPAATGPAEESAGFPELPSFDTSLGGPEEDAQAAAGPLDPSAWDVDRFRRPLAGGSAPPLRPLRQGAAGIAVLALGMLAFIGLGAASATAGALVRHRVAYLYVLPAMLGMTLLVFFPFVYGIALSFTSSSLYNTERSLAENWVGLANYAEVLGNWSFGYDSFYWTLFITVVWTVTNVTLGVTVGLALALVLNTKGLALRPVYRVLLILPWAVPTYITALTWRGMFHQQFGVVNQLLQIFGLSAVSWYDTPFTSFLTALTTNAWLSFPFMMVVSLGALQSIPAELYEAARVDGATRWQQFRAITLPSLKPALVPAVILSVVWTFNQFNVIFLVTAGEPGGSTEILITKAYRIAFEKYRYGYAAAYSTVIFVILLAYGVLQNRLTRATEEIA